MIDQLPQYKCHKIVRAGKLEHLAFNGGTASIEGLEAPVTFSSDTAARLLKAYTFRTNPEDRGYVVVYEDGYISWSPSKAFEDGYTKL